MEADDLRRRLVPGADLRGADLREVSQWGEGDVQLSNTNLSGADLRGADLGAPIFDGANLRGANLSGLVLRRGQFAVASFERADLTEADLSGVNIDGSFDGAVLDGANLDGAVLSSCTFRDASLRGTNFTRAVLPNDISSFGGARFDSSTRWSEYWRAQAVAHSVAGPDGIRVVKSPAPAAPSAPPAQQPGRIGPVVGRVAAFLFGAGLTVYAVLFATGQVDFLGSLIERDTDVSDQIVGGLIMSAFGLILVGGAIFGFPESSPSRGRRSRGGGIDAG